MLTSKQILTTLAVAGVLLCASCAGNGLDDGDSADVILEIEQMQTSAVTANPQTGTGTCSISGSGCTINADCPLVGEQCQGASGCELQANEWTATFRNEPKNSVADVPFNDIVLSTVDITYTWQNAVTGVDFRSIGLNGVTIQIGESAQTRFFPITSADLLNPAVEGNSASMAMNFRGRTIEGSNVSHPASALLFIEDCP